MTTPTDPGTRILFCAQEAGPHVGAFEAAASELGVRVVYAIDQHPGARSLRGQRPVGNGPSGDRPPDDAVLAVAFDRAGALDAVLAAHAHAAVSGLVAVDDAAVVFAAAAAAELGLPFHTLAGAQAAGDPLLTRGRLLAADLPTPWFVALEPGLPVEAVLDRVRLPCVVKPLPPARCRGVERVDEVAQLAPAVARLRQRARPAISAGVLIEGFVPGRELTLEGVMVRGQLLVLAILEKPAPLAGRFLRETICVTPASLGFDDQRRMAAMIVHGALAMGLRHGPVHAECLVGDAGMFVLQIAARPITGPCARALRFVGADGATSTLAALLLRHAVGQSLDGWGREAEASGVMTLLVERAGRLRGVDGVDAARTVEGVTAVDITAQPDDMLAPPPDGESALGCIQARAATATGVMRALQAARAALSVHVDENARSR